MADAVRCCDLVHIRYDDVRRVEGSPSPADYEPRETRMLVGAGSLAG